MPSDTPLFELRQSTIQGRGAFARQDIRAGTRIMEYTGERISQKEADRRYDDESMQRHHTFLFSLESGKVIDGAVGGSDARYINHSCDPNCQTIEERGRIFVEALTDIRKGEELGYDYAYERTDATTPEDEKLYACRCGSPKCRGTILAPAKSKGAGSRGAGKKRTAKKGAGGKGAGSRKQGAGKQSGAKKGTAKKKSAGKSAAKKSGAKKSGAKKSGSKQGGSRKSASKGSSVKKSGAKTSASKKSASKQGGARKSASKQGAAKTSATKKSAAKKSTRGRTA